MADHRHAGMVSDEALLQNIAQGCEDCFNLLFLRFFRSLSSMVCKIVRDRSEAEDVVQDVFVAIHKQRERFNPSVGSARTWILQFGYYKALKRRRYLARRHFYDQQGNGAREGRDGMPIQPEFIQKSIECRERIQQGLACLTAGQRRVIELVHFEGHTLREISEIEGKALTSIRNSYYRGLHTLKDVISDEVRPSHLQSMISPKRQEEL